MTSCAHVRRRADGFTVVELLVAVVITGLIVGVGGAVLVQGLTLTPRAQDRTLLASKVTRLTDALSDDAANAATIATRFNVFTDVHGCRAAWVTPSAVGPVSDPAGIAGRLDMTLVDGTHVQYRGVVRSMSRDGHRAIAVVRSAGGIDDVVATGWCRDGSTPAPFSHTYADPTLTTTLRLASSPGSEVRPVAIGSARRTTG